ncbi:hypothetical protein OG883_10120 [Streptomyces sp. NBC_01142]|uniref:hypothetical protein n=1 Tax=Streptomyces sp. NBC_01142 TaxID=2975865 RepID=UPI00224D12D3|nr:hypothetical protein [Streptomyces sp. NBC_01142]MCX4820254.1 hypothetical protein [Streptomyces sp. NBC_01142]
MQVLSPVPLPAGRTEQDSDHDQTRWLLDRFEDDPGPRISISFRVSDKPNTAAYDRLLEMEGEIIPGLVMSPRTAR